MVNTASKWGGGGAGGGRAEEQQVGTAGARVAGAEARDGSAGDWPGAGEVRGLATWLEDNCVGLLQAIAS